MTEPAWLSDVRELVHADPSLQRALLSHESPTDFAVALTALTGQRVTVDDVAAAAREARREWLERWVS